MVSPEQVVSLVKEHLGDPVFGVPTFPDVTCVVSPRVSESGGLILDVIGDYKDCVIDPANLEVISPDEMRLHDKGGVVWSLRRLKRG